MKSFIENLSIQLVGIIHTTGDGDRTTTLNKSGETWPLRHDCTFSQKFRTTLIQLKGVELNRFQYNGFRIDLATFRTYLARINKGKLFGKTKKQTKGETKIFLKY